jgi:PAS domain S-box-containing protein
MKLRSHLFRLIVGTLLPMIACAAVGSWVFARYQRATFERGATERTLALVTALDAELRSTMATAEALATSRDLDTGDLRSFYEDAVAVLASQRDWLTINLAAPDGQQLLNVLRPFGTSLPRIEELASFERVLTTGMPAVSGLVVGRLTQQHDFAVRVPVIRNGTTKYVLSAAVKPTAINRLLAAQRLPGDWVGVVVDGNMRIVTRTVAPERTVGTLASESLQEALSRRPEGWFSGHTVEGAAVYTPYNRSQFSGWTVAMGIPAAAVEGTARRTIASLVAGVVAAVLVASLLGLLLARRIAVPIAALAAAARAIGRGDRPAISRDTDVEEVADLGRTLEEAAAAIRVREETQSQMAAIVESSSDAIITYSPEGIVLTWNPGAVRLFGYTAEEVHGRDVAVLVPPDRRAEVAAVFEAVARGEYRTLETVGVRKDGSAVQVALTVSPIRNEAGRIVRVSAMGRDITEQKQGEEALRAASRAKDEFLAMLGHELRNPLGAIAGAVGVLNIVGKLEGPAERARAVIGRQVEHLSRLVDDLLDVSRVTTGKVTLVQRPLDLGELAASVMATWRASGRFEAHQVGLDVSEAWVHADETRMEQVIGNLVGNAVKYTPAGGRIAVRVASEGASAIFEVADTGMGIPSALLDTVFDLFVQGDRGLDRNQGGLGLGLSLTKTLVEMHSGTVHVSSGGRGKGSTFTVRLPAIALVERPPKAAGPRATAACRRILVIEDNDDAREMLRIALALEGHEVHEAADGAAGLRAAAALEPDVAFVDVGLPGLDGYEVARRIRQLPGGDSIRLIALTGYGQREDRRRALDAGFDAHVTKPVSTERLLAVFTQLTSKGTHRGS